MNMIVDDLLPLMPKKNNDYGFNDYDFSFMEQEKSPRLYNQGMGKHGGWWGPIIEKAYCKFNIACAYISSGLAVEAFRDLTGMPSVQYHVHEQDDRYLFKSIKQAVDKKWVMVAGSEHNI